MTETIVTSSIPADTRLLRVHSYESLGTYDGPGIRLVVFYRVVTSVVYIVQTPIP